MRRIEVRLTDYTELNLTGLAAVAAGREAVLSGENQQHYQSAFSLVEGQESGILGMSLRGVGAGTCGQTGGGFTDSEASLTERSAGGHRQVSRDDADRGKPVQQTSAEMWRKCYKRSHGKLRCHEKVKGR